MINPLYWYVFFRVRICGPTNTRRAEVARAVEEEGAQSIVLDLRHNPGGFFPGGIDVAR